MKIKTKVSKKIVLPCSILVVALCATAFGFAMHQSTKPLAENQTNSPKTDLSPPTPAEQAQVEDTKQNIVTANDEATVKSDAVSQDNPTTKKTVLPNIIDAAQYSGSVEVRAIIPSIYETDGTCTFTFTQGAAAIKLTTTAFADASSTQCTPLHAPASSFHPSGSWKLIVTYSSSHASGDSNPVNVDIGE